MGYAKPTENRLADQRARRRATALLIERHQREWDELFAMHKIAALAEIEDLAAKAREAAGSADGEDAPLEPVRLKPGRRKEGETPLERIDVARCRVCITHHDRGHACPSCGARPALVTPRQVREALAEDGATVGSVAERFGLSRSVVRKVAEGVHTARLV